MSSHHNRKYQTKAKKTGETPAAAVGKPQKVGLLARLQRRPGLIYVFGFAAVWCLLCLLYGDVLYRTEQESFVTVDAMQMKQVTDLTYGWWYFAARLALSIFHFRWIGGTLLALMLTAIAWLINYLLRIPPRLWALSWLVPFGFFAWYVWLGYHIFFEAEPSLFLLVPMLLFMVLSLLALPVSFIRKKPCPCAVTADETSALQPKKTCGKGLCCYTSILVFMLAGMACSIWKLHTITFLMVFFCVLTLCAAAWLLVLCRSEKPQVSGKRSVGISLLCIIAVTAAAWWATDVINNNEIISCRQQNRMMEGDWQGMIDDALSARQPNRTVAAYHAVGLVFTDRLLDGMFQLPYHYPDTRLNAKSKNNEYSLLLPDCNYATGLLNPAYHAAFEHIVTNGLRLRHLKRMAICAILNDEPQLAEKYMAILKTVPFEGDFVEKYEPMIKDRTLVEQDAELSRVLAFYPREQHFEQQYRQPAFMGYNMGLLSGTDATLVNSVAATLYSKDLRAFILRAPAFKQKGWAFPRCMQEAIVLYDLSFPNDHALDYFKGNIDEFVMSQVKAFANAAQPYAGDKDAMRDNLRNNWIGSYFYYYYCENNNPNQIAHSENKAGVN